MNEFSSLRASIFHNRSYNNLLFLFRFPQKNKSICRYTSSEGCFFKTNFLYVSLFNQLFFLNFEYFKHLKTLPRYCSNVFWLLNMLTKIA